MTKIPAATGKNKMDENIQTIKSIRHYSEHIMRVERACSWLGIERGRAAQYSSYIRELYEKEDKRSHNHVLSLNESYEIVEIYDLWESHVNRFPGIKEKIKRCLEKGPLLREGENPDSSTNRPRNDAFVFLLAGKLIRGNMNVIAIDGLLARGVSCHIDADITFEWNGEYIDIQCKRPQNTNSLEKRVKQATGQINTTKRPSQKGIIAVDCSALIRPPGRLLERNSAEIALQDVADILQESIMPIVGKLFKPHIMLTLLFARVPAMTIIDESPILTISGEPFRTYRPESVSPSLGVINDNFIDPNLVDSISERLKSSVV